MTTLLSLPAEIRDLIWHFVFILPTQPVPLALSPHRARHTSVLRVLTVSKQILNEALHIFYRCNNLSLRSTSALFAFLSALHRKRRLEITSLTVTGFGLHYTGYQCASRAFSMLLLCPKLTSFQLDLSIEYSWIILDTIPASAFETHWIEFQLALDCLSNLRGLTHGSIRGIDPSVFRNSFPQHELLEADMQEARCHRADQLRAAWARPALTSVPRQQSPSGAISRCPPKLPVLGFDDTDEKLLKVYPRELIANYSPPICATTEMDALPNLHLGDMWPEFQLNYHEEEEEHEDHENQESQEDQEDENETTGGQVDEASESPDRHRRSWSTVATVNSESPRRQAFRRCSRTCLPI
jgi:hypothetical protein